MSIKTRIAALALAALAVTGAIASTTTQAEAKGFPRRLGFSAPVWSAPPSSAARSPPAMTATTNDGGYRRCGWVRQFDAYGNYSAASAAAIDHRIYCVFRETPRPARPPHPPPCRTRPARLSPRAGHLFESKDFEPCCMAVTTRCHSTASPISLLLLRITCNTAGNNRFARSIWPLTTTIGKSGPAECETASFLWWRRAGIFEQR